MTEKIHPTAVIAPTAQIGSNVAIGPFTLVDDGAVIGDNTVLDSHVVIGKNVKIGRNNRIFPCAVIGRPPQILGFDENTKFGGWSYGDNNTIAKYSDDPPEACTRTRTGGGPMQPADDQCAPGARLSPGRQES